MEGITQTGLSAAAPLTPMNSFTATQNPIEQPTESNDKEESTPGTPTVAPIEPATVTPVPTEAAIAPPVAPATTATAPVAGDDMDKPVDPLEDWKSFLYDKFKKFNEAIGKYADEITKNYQSYLVVISAIIALFALLLTFVYGISQALAPILDRFRGVAAEGAVCGAVSSVDPNKTITLKALKEYIKHAKEAGTEEITFIDLYEKAAPKRPFRFRDIFSYFNISSFFLQWNKNIFSSLFSWFTLIFTIVTGIWTSLEVVQPFLNLWTTLNVGVLIDENKRREERERNHEQKKFVQTCIVGWNIFERFTDPLTNEERCSLIMPTETSFDLEEFLKDDNILFQKVNQIIEAEPPAILNANPNCPDFFVVLPSSKDHMDFVRRISNRVSETVKSSQFPAFAHRRTRNAKAEQALFVVTCEKEAGVQVRHTRVWIIFPSELKMLLNYSWEEINDPNGYFYVERPHWRIRVKNLYLWAKAEYEEVEVNGEKVFRRKNTTPYASQTILLPLD